MSLAFETACKMTMSFLALRNQNKGAPNWPKNRAHSVLNKLVENNALC
jgi:hypothetical protein